MKQGLPLLVSCVNFVCLVVIIAHGLMLSVKVEDSTSRAKDAIGNFEIIMENIKGRVEKTVDNIDEIVVQMDMVLKDMRTQLKFLKRVENSTNPCKNVTFLSEFTEYAKVFCY